MATREPDSPEQTRPRLTLIVGGLGEPVERIGAGRAPRQDAKEPARARTPRRAVPVLLRVRADLVGAQPPIWRALDVRSDVSLADLHLALQAVFGWTDHHLHRFSIGGGPFDEGAEQFLCAFDLDEGDDGVSDAEVTIDEVLADVGDVLHYLYDYGDYWDLRIVQQQVFDLPDDAPAALCVNGRRAAPPEDCGGLRAAADLREVLADPLEFDIEGLNARLRGLADPIAKTRPRR